MYVEFQIAFQGGGSPIYDLYIPLEANRDPIRPFLGLNIHLGNLENGFE